MGLSEVASWRGTSLVSGVCRSIPVQGRPRVTFSSLVTVSLALSLSPCLSITTFPLEEENYLPAKPGSAQTISRIVLRTIRVLKKPSVFAKNEKGPHM